jgi:hypothetical protein
MFSSAPQAASMLAGASHAGAVCGAALLCDAPPMLRFLAPQMPPAMLCRLLCLPAAQLPPCYNDKGF